jgi:hypothetical protein
MRVPVKSGRVQKRKLHPQTTTNVEHRGDLPEAVAPARHPWSALQAIEASHWYSPSAARFGIRLQSMNMCPGGFERVRCSRRGLSSFEAADCVVAGESDDRIRSLGAVQKVGPGAPAAWRRSR